MINNNNNMKKLAYPRLQKTWPHIQLALVGEGPMMEGLHRLAEKLSIAKSVHFLGSITEHKNLAPWILSCDLFVAPGQIGLQAPMALIYGKALVISDESRLHGPEVQAFVPGQTGLDYKDGNIDDLEQKVNRRLLAEARACRLCFYFL